MHYSNFRRMAFAVTTGVLLLSGCANDYAQNRQMDWEARHFEAHRRMMDYYGGAACEFGGPGVGPGMGMGLGPGAGPGAAAMTPEQYRAMMAAHIRAMPPEVIKRRMEIMEMQMQLMREQLASQPAAK